MVTDMLRAISYFLIFIIHLSVIPVRGDEQVSLPPATRSLISDYCLDCHDSESGKGNIILDQGNINWNDPEQFHLWEKVIKAVRFGEMPPPKKPQPTDQERARLINWLNSHLVENSPEPEHLPRRLNRDEYRETIRSVFGYDFKLPDGFPLDGMDHGFDNVGEALVLSPTLMQAYAECATLVADQILNPGLKPAGSKTTEVRGDEMTISYSTSHIRDGAMQLVSKSDTVFRSCTWPSKFEARHSGIYRLKIEASQFLPRDLEGEMLLEVRAKDTDTQDNAMVKDLRLLGTFKVTSESPESFELECELFQGETPVFYYANAELDSSRDARDRMKWVFWERMKHSPKMIAAWQKLVKGAGQGFRGGIGWERVKKFMQEKDLDLSQATEDSQATQAFLKKVAGNPVLYVETISYDYFENGPTLNIHQVTIDGPVRQTFSPQEKLLIQRKNEFLSVPDDSPRGTEAEIGTILRRHLTKAFRREVGMSTLLGYRELVLDHMASGHTMEEGLHLAVRASLMSPHFIYRSGSSMELDPYHLASRLSYFLTSGPPDGKLMASAKAGTLTDKVELGRHARRLLKSPNASHFFNRFSHQWLGTHNLNDIMPDPNLNFSNQDLIWAAREIEKFFEVMVHENRKMEEFIAPDFTWTSREIARKIYGVTGPINEKKNGLQKISLKHGGRYGGVLGFAGTLTATANGVDTQPVVRGVWFLERILGESPPPPPEAVPPITPDTTGARSPRELLKLHTDSPDCAGCHKKIDPFGLIMENFDAVGRWRKNYDSDETTNEETTSPDIDTECQLADGTTLRDMLDLKKWLVDDIDRFSNGLARHLMIYATGRDLNFRENEQISNIVQSVHAEGNGFQDLIIALIQSDIFSGRQSARSK